MNNNIIRTENYESVKYNTQIEDESMEKRKIIEDELNATTSFFKQQTKQFDSK